MADHLAGAEIAAVPLADPDPPIPTLNLDLVWRHDGLPPAAALVITVADALTHAEGGIR